MATKPVVVISSGGTGGHIWPAYTVAQELYQKGSHKVIWVGSHSQLERSILSGAPWICYHLPTTGMRGKGVRTKLWALIKLFVALLIALGLMIRLRPSHVLTFGGFASFPMGIVSLFFRAKLWLFEQNAVSGWVNRILVRWADKIFTAYPRVRGLSAYQNRCMYVGNPLRQSIIKMVKNKQASQSPTDVMRVLVLGGSQGSEIMNRLVPQFLQSIQRQMGTTELKIYHQCGHGEGRKYSVQGTYRLMGLKAEVFEFDRNMKVYEQADILIARSGAMTVSEAVKLAIPSIYIPLGNAVDNHQWFNALYYQDCGVATILTEYELSDLDLIVKKCLSLFKDTKRRESIQKRLTQLGRSNASSIVSDLLVGEIAAENCVLE